MAGFISLADAKLHLRVDGPDEDSLIAALIAAAGVEVERTVGLVAPARPHIFQFNCFAQFLELRLGPVDLDTIEISYLDLNGDQQSLADFRAVAQDGVVRILPAIGSSWPAAARAIGAISVTATVGYIVTEETGAATAPAHVKHAVRLCVGSWFSDREAGSVPLAAIHLLNHDRNRRI